MRKALFYLVACIAIISMVVKPQSAKASHAAGAELLYEWVSDSTYRFYFKFYRDCTGIPEQTTQDLCVYNSCSNTSFTVTMNKWTGTLPGGLPNGSMLPVGCAQDKTTCDSPASLLPGYREWWYSAIITLPSRCNSWTFATWISARTSNNNIPSTNLYIETTMDNTGNRQGNSSPYFSIRPNAYGCVNMPTTMNNGAVDPNGDSLVTEIMTPQDGSSCSGSSTNITFNTATPPYSIPTNPLQTNNTFNINAATGQMSFTPTQQGASTLTVRVKEYRNGVLIGSIMRDMVINIMPCTTTVPNITVSPSVSGGVYTNGQVRGCINKPLSFNVTTSGATGSVLVVGDNHNFSIPTATVTHNFQRTNNVVTNVSWTPSANDTGTKTLLLTVKDSTCRPPGIMLYYTNAIPIFVWGKTTALNDTTICPGDTATLVGTKGGNYTWYVLSGSLGSLSCTNCPNTFANPALTSRYLLLSSINNYCSPYNRDTVTVTVDSVLNPSMYMTVSPDTIIWLGLNATFTAHTTNCPAPSYQWFRNGTLISGATDSVLNLANLKKKETISCAMYCNSSCANPKLSTDSIRMYVSAGIDDVADNNGIKIYPNPNNGSFTLSVENTGSGNSPLQVEVYNSIGQLVYKDAVLPANNKLNTTLSLTELPNGIYNLHLKGKDNTRLVNFSIQR